MNVKILSIQIGYVSPVHDTCTPEKLQAKTDLDAALQEGIAETWAKPIDRDLHIDEHDEWVARYLTTQINAAVMSEDDRVAITEDHVATLLPVTKQTLAALGDDLPKAKETRCKLVGKEWHNSRSYFLFPTQPQGKWPKNSQKECLYIVTLTWLCWPRDAALR